MRQARILLLMGLILTVGVGCSLFQQPTAQPQPQAKAKAVTKAPPEPVGRYYDFEDIQVPRSLSLVEDESKVFVVNNFKVGMLVLRNNVNADSLINYFTESMTKDNWVLKSSFKYPAVLFFAKRGKACVIQIYDHTFNTEVKIIVAPTLVSK